MEQSLPFLTLIQYEQLPFDPLWLADEMLGTPVPLYGSLKLEFEPSPGGIRVQPWLGTLDISKVPCLCWDRSDPVVKGSLEGADPDVVIRPSLGSFIRPWDPGNLKLPPRAVRPSTAAFMATGFEGRGRLVTPDASVKTPLMSCRGSSFM